MEHTPTSTGMSERATAAYNSSTPEPTATSVQSLDTGLTDISSNSTTQTTEAVTTDTTIPAIGAESSTTSAMWSTTLVPTRQATTIANQKQPQASYGLDQNAIIAGSVAGLLLIAIILMAVCLARARQRRRSGDRDKTPRPAPAGASVLAREPNPYTNACFNAAKEEMAERPHQTEEPAKSTAESINSVRNKEDHWIIPLEELAEDDTTATFDTTKF